MAEESRADGLPRTLSVNSLFAHDFEIPSTHHFCFSLASDGDRTRWKALSPIS